MFTAISILSMVLVTASSAFGITALLVAVQTHGQGLVSVGASSIGPGSPLWSFVTNVVTLVTYFLFFGGV